MKPAEHKIIAKEALRNKWGISIAVVLIITAITFVLNLIPLIGGLATLVISPAIAYIPLQLFLKIKRNEETRVEEIFSSIFNNLGTYWGIMLRTLQQLLPIIILILVGFILSIFGTIGAFAEGALGIVAFIGSILTFVGSILSYTKSLYYVQAIYIITDNPELTCKEAVLRSKELMEGHRFEYFYLQLTFIGWILLTGITFGLVMFYLEPYMYTTFASYYDNLVGNNAKIDNEYNSEVVIDG